MSERRKRVTKILLLAGLALAVTTSSGAAAAGPFRPALRGVVPHRGQLALAPVGHTGPATLTFNATYENLINQYFTDVAHDSGTSSNVYSVATQYYDNPGQVHVQYQSTFGGSYIDHDPLPANGCDDGFDVYCVNDHQLQHEIQNVLTANGWHGGLDHIFFLITPNGVGSCFDAAGVNCSTNVFCAYHNTFADTAVEHVIYANEPYEGPYPGCTGSAQGFPNDTDADTTINTISHEHNEAITDPLTDPNHLAWTAADGSENGDLCANGYGIPLGGTPGSTAYNQVINGHNYSLQQEYSNVDNGCIQHTGGAATAPTFGSGPLVYNGGPVMHTNTVYAIYWLPTARNTTRPAVTGRAVVNRTLTTTPGKWALGGVPSSYQWQRCSRAGKSCVDVPGATAAAYQLTSADAGHALRSTVRATNVNGVSPAAASAGTAAVVDTPSVTKAPHISGHTKVGRKLSGNHGAWKYSPTYRYQWLRCNATSGGSCSAIHKATHSTYRLTKRDADHRLRLLVTATNAAGSAKATSAPSARVRS